MKKLILVSAIAIGALLAVPASAWAADYPAGDVPPTSGEPGATLNFSIQTEQPNTPGTVVVDGDEVTDATVTAAVTHELTTGADGLAKFGVLLPATAKPGSTYSVTLTVGDFKKVTTIDVADAQLATDPLPEAAAAPESAAGIDPGLLWFGGGAVALVAGLVGVLAVRRSRKANAAE